jgi:hypothetical protein
MTGPEHYQAAETIVTNVTDPATTLPPAVLAIAIAEAQVHATLALAAGVGLIIAAEAEPPEAACAAWAAAIGAQPAPS